MSTTTSTKEHTVTITTLAHAITHTGVDVLDYLDRDANIPTVTSVACQGDVSIVRDDDTAPATAWMPPSVAVVRGESGGNTHSLHPVGPCAWAPSKSSSPTDLTLGTLTVLDGSQALMLHPEHGALLIDPGTYRIGRQREYAGEWAYVAD